MNYESKKAELENKIKELQNELENLKKQESKEAWEKSLVEKFKEFIESTDFAEVEAVEIKARTKNPAVAIVETYFYNEPEDRAGKIPETPAKVESEPKAEPEKPENKIIIASIPKPEEPKKRMTLDEFIDSLPEPAAK